MKRFRQYRLSQAVRDQFADVPAIEPTTFIYPYFVVEGENVRDEISSMRGVYRLSIDKLVEDVADARSLGIDKVLLFGVIEQAEKDPRGSKAYSPDNLVSRATRAIKAAYPDVVVITDICLCEYTSHGHCGLLNGETILNDETLPLLAEMAYQHALAGADFVAPSAMMDGQIEALKQRITEAGLPTRILAYSAKYASAYYGPFRDAADSAPSFGDRKTYQMDFRTKDQGLQEIEADIEEGADWIMVKPALAYLDVVYRAKQAFPNLPLVTYQVSGEYSMLLNGARDGLFIESRIFDESLTAMRRAGADYIITYYAKQYLRNHGG